MSITQEQLDEIKAANAGLDLHVIENPITGDQLVCKSPGVEWTRYMAEQEGKPYPARLTAGKVCITMCAVHPPRADVERMLAERPGLVQTFIGELGEIAGATNKASHRKL